MKHFIFYLSFLLCVSGFSKVLADEQVKFTPNAKTPEEIILYVEKSAQLFLDKDEKKRSACLPIPTDRGWTANGISS